MAEPSENITRAPTMVIDLVGIARGDKGRRCLARDDHCGVIVQPGLTVRFRHQEIHDHEFPDALYVYEVTPGGDGCHVGFLKDHLVFHVKEYDGKCAVVTEVFTTAHPSVEVRRLVYHYCGLAQAVLIKEEDGIDVKEAKI